MNSKSHLKLVSNIRGLTEKFINELPKLFAHKIRDTQNESASTHGT